MRKNTKLIAVVCYNTISFWKSRKKAISFFKEGVKYCDGCEAERYANVLIDLLDGRMLCEDQSSRTYQWLKDNNCYEKFPNGTNVRDLTGKVEYPLDEWGLCMELPDLWK